jgi:hypothetical protein
MMLAARIKKGTAMRGKLSRPANIRWGKIDSGIGVVRAKTTNVTPARAMNIGRVEVSAKPSSVKIKPPSMSDSPQPSVASH